MTRSYCAQVWISHEYDSRVATALMCMSEWCHSSYINDIITPTFIHMWLLLSCEWTSDVIHQPCFTHLDGPRVRLACGSCTHVNASVMSCWCHTIHIHPEKRRCYSYIGFVKDLAHTHTIYIYIYISSRRTINISIASPDAKRAHIQIWIAYEWVMSHIWKSHVTRMNGHVTQMNESCHTYEWVMSHIWMSHVKDAKRAHIQIIKYK